MMLPTMTRVDELLSISSEALAPKPKSLPKLLEPYALGRELFQMLQSKNGFYAFESALHVFPLTSAAGMSLEEWNSESLWRGVYQYLAEGLLFFAEDAFQDQFALSACGVLRFKAETGETSCLADSIDGWAENILRDYKTETGWPLASRWQADGGPLPAGKRLVPTTPFFLGGKYSIENLWVGDAVEGMRYKADVAIQTRSLSNGSNVKLIVGKKLTAQ
jgi:hypothetical protein